jgi:hypothetical protein
MALWAGDWTAPVEVRHEFKPVVTYRARLSGDSLAVEVKLDSGWHTFAMDNQQRAEAKLAGKKALGIDRATEIKLSGGLEIAGTWLQSPPKDFSKPELRWYTWGFEEKAVFVAKVKRGAGGEGQIGVRGQACTDSVCKNIDVQIPIPRGEGKDEGGGLGMDLKGMVAVGQ